MTNRVAMIRSNNLLTMLRRLIGLYEEVTKGGLSILLTEYYAGGKIEKNEMCGACVAYGGGERGVQGSGGET